MLFIRFLPAIAIAEVKGVTPMADPHTGHGTAAGYAAGPQAEPTHLLPTAERDRKEDASAASTSGTRPRPSTEGAALPATTTHGAEPIKPTTPDGRAK